MIDPETAEFYRDMEPLIDAYKTTFTAMTAGGTVALIVYSVYRFMKKPVKPIQIEYTGNVVPFRKREDRKETFQEDYLDAS